MKLRIIFLFSILSVTVFSSCDKDCYDSQLYYEHRSDVCPTDCPGVEGCDGKTYCNACEANKVGIAVKP